MIPENFDWRELPSFIYLTGFAITYSNFLWVGFTRAELHLLLNCVEDNIKDDKIDYKAAWELFQASLPNLIKEKENDERKTDKIRNSGVV